MSMNTKRALYESIMANVARQVKSALNEGSEGGYRDGMTEQLLTKLYGLVDRAADAESIDEYDSIHDNAESIIDSIKDQLDTAMETIEEYGPEFKERLLDALEGVIDSEYDEIWEDESYESSELSYYGANDERLKNWKV